MVVSFNKKRILDIMRAFVALALLSAVLTGFAASMAVPASAGPCYYYPPNVYYCY